MDASIAERLGTFIAELSIDAIPPDVLGKVRRHTLDTFGVTLRGASSPEAEMVRRVVGAETSSGQTQLWGSGLSAAAPAAALANGVAAHALELDDASGCDHSGAVVVPAAVAALSLAPAATGGDLVAAITAGYDVGRRVLDASGGYDAHNGAGWHSTGTCGSFAAAAAAARILGLDAHQSAMALAIAGSFTGGLWAFTGDGAMTKRLHVGKAAEAGLTAAMLAREGFTGPRHIFEAEWGGFLGTYAPTSAAPLELTRSLGEIWRIETSSLKPYASCRGTHAAIEMVLELRAQEGVTATGVESVVVGVTPTVMQMCGNSQVGSLLEAQLSLPYAVAVALLFGSAGIDEFEPEIRTRADVKDLASRIEVRADPAVTSNVAARIELQHQGRTLCRSLETPLGSPARPLSDIAVDEKFYQLATPVIGREDAEQLVLLTRALGPGTDLALLRRLLAGDEPARGA